MKRTKIICTIGPSSQNPETIRELIKEGMDVARLNFSHGSYEEQTNKFRMVRDAAKELSDTHEEVSDHIVFPCCGFMWTEPSCHSCGNAPSFQVRARTWWKDCVGSLFGYR